MFCRTGSVISAAMGALGANYYGRLRLMVIADTSSRPQLIPAEKPPTPEELEDMLSREPSLLLTVVGVVGLAVIIWLMRFKPF